MKNISDFDSTISSKNDKQFNTVIILIISFAFISLIGLTLIGFVIYKILNHFGIL